MKMHLLREPVASKQRSRFFMVSLGLFGVGVFLAFAFIGFQSPNSIPGRSYYYVYAEFKDADNITPHNEVRVDGDIVGQVLDPHVSHGIAVVKLQLAPSVAPLRSDTRVQVVPRSAIGVRYIEVTPGTKGTKLASGSLIPYAQTSSSTPLDTALSTFNAPTRANVKKFLRSFSEGLAGEGQNINATLGAAPAFMQNTTDVLNAIIARPNAVVSLIHGAGVMAGTTEPVDTTLSSGFQPEADSAQALADNGANIDATFSQAPPTLRTVQTKLPAFDTLATQLTGFARAITPGLKAAPAALHQTSVLLNQAKPELVDATEVLHTTGQAVSPTLGLLDAVQPDLNPIQAGLQSATPVVEKLGQHGCDIVNFGKNWSSMMQYGSSEGNVLRFDIASFGVASVEGATTQSDTTSSDPYPAPCLDGKVQ